MQPGPFLTPVEILFTLTSNFNGGVSEPVNLEMWLRGRALAQHVCVLGPWLSLQHHLAKHKQKVPKNCFRELGEKNKLPIINYTFNTFLQRQEN